MSELLLLGVSHKTAHVALRERIALTEVESERFLRDLTTDHDVHEAVAISTCNRTELYLVVGDPVAAENAVLTRLATRAGIRPTELADVIYSPRNCDAARQLFRVAAGLESMIVGESEVQGQVRRAHELAVEHGFSGPLTNRLFTSALQTGGRVRAETGISRGRASVSSVAVDLAEEIVGDLTERHVVDHRRRRDERADGAGARRAWRQDDLRGQPPRLPRTLGRGALRRRRRLARRASRAARVGRHRRLVDLVAASDRRRRGARADHGRAARSPAGR